MHHKVIKSVVEVLDKLVREYTGTSSTRRLFAFETTPQLD
jgi:hypothetical protein